MVAGIFVFFYALHFYAALASSKTPNAVESGTAADQT